LLIQVDAQFVHFVGGDAFGASQWLGHASLCALPCNL
jgi:hypothetical protein